MSTFSANKKKSSGKIIPPHSHAPANSRLSLCRIFSRRHRRIVASPRPQARRRSLPRRFPSGLSRPHLPALPELPSRRRCPSARRRQPRPHPKRKARQRRPRRLRHALRHLPPNHQSSRRPHASRQSQMVSSHARTKNGFRRPLPGPTLPPDQRPQPKRQPLPLRPLRPHRQRRSRRLGLAPRRRPHSPSPNSRRNRRPTKNLDRLRRLLPAIARR